MQNETYSPRQLKFLMLMAVLFLGLGLTALFRDGEITGAFWILAGGANITGLLAAFGKNRRLRVRPLFRTGTLGLLAAILFSSLTVRTSEFDQILARDIVQGNTLLLRGSLSLGADRNAAIGFTSRPLLGVAVGRHQREAARILLDFGADPNRSDINGWTPLSIARFRNDEDMAALLTVYGATEHPLPVLPKKKPHPEN